MATLGTYRINQTDILPSQAGNATIAIYNKVGSAKKIYIKNVEIQNFRRDALGTNARVTDWEMKRISSQTTGIEVSAAKLDTSASNIPSQIKIYKGGNAIISETTLTISATTTLAFAATTITRAANSWLVDGIIQGAKINISGTASNNTGNLTITTPGNLTFASAGRTITRSAGSWITDGVTVGARITVTGTTSNNKTFTVLTRDSATQVTCIATDLLITEGPVGATYTAKALWPYYIVKSTTATVITVETQFVMITEGANAAGVATASIPLSLGRFCTRHNWFSTTTNAFMNNSNIGNQHLNTGSMYNAHSGGSLIEPIWLAAGEGLSVLMNNTLDIDAALEVKEFHTYLVECLFTLDWSPDNTYFMTDYMTPNGEGSPLFSIMNNTGSGRNVKVIDITISEIGDTSTPYFMIVPFDYIEPLASLDSYRTVPYMKMDTNNPSIDSYINIKKDVSLYPKGFSAGGALFPLSFGSAVPASGLNYYITKDFLGPIYSAFFAEKSELQANPTTTITNNMVSFSQKDSTLLTSNDLYLAEGEGIAIVASAEPLSGVGAGVANQVNKFAMGKFDYSINFEVVDVTVDLTLTGLASGSEVKIFTHGTTTELSSSNLPVTLQDSGDTITLANHGIVDGTRVTFSSITGTTGIGINISYYIVNATISTFQVSTTLGGGALPLTTDGTGIIFNPATSFSWSYVYSAATYVDIVILHLQYNYYRIDNLLLTSTGSTIPVQQIIDRVYANP